MVNGILLGATITLLCGCAATAAGDDADAGSIATRSTVCDQELTGTHFKRCARDGARVEVISRDELELIKNRTAPVMQDPAALAH